MDNIQKKLQISNSSINFSLTNLNNIMSKTFYSKGSKSPINKFNFVNNADIKINNDKNNHNNEKEMKFKRFWSSQNIIINNKNTKPKCNLINNKNKKSNYFYSVSIYSAPSAQENRLEIDRMVKINRNKRLSDLNNLHNSLMIKESKIYRKKLQSLSKDNSFENDEKAKIKKRYNMNDMSELNNIRYNLHQTFQEYYLRKRYKRNIKNNDTSLKNSFNSKKDNKGIISKNNSFKYLNDNTPNTKRTNYLSHYISGKNSNKSISLRYRELNKNKKFDLNYLTNNVKVLSAGTSNKNIKNKLNQNLESTGKNNIESENKNENPFRVYKEIEISKMSLDLNNILFNQNQKVHLSELGKKLLKYKSLKVFQENRLELMSKKDINGLIERIILLEKSLKKFNSLSIEYFKEINNYIRFLKDEIFILRNDYDQENIKRLNLYFEVEKLVTDNILKQRELEHLIEIKFFCIQVKYNMIKQPTYFNQTLKEVSRKYELGKLILGLKNYPQNPNVIRFLDSIPEIKNLILNPPSPPTHKIKTFLKKKTINNIRMDSPLIKDKDKEIKNILVSPNKKVFESPEELFILFDNIEWKNLRLMKDNDYIKRNINRIQKEYDDIYRSTLFLEKFNDIDKKEEILKKLREENTALNGRFNHLKNNKFNDEENNTKKYIREGERGIYLDLNIFKKYTYYKMLENYKYKGLLLLEKLNEFIKDFFSLNYLNYGINRAYKLIGKNPLNKVLSINRKNINNLDKSIINDYILILIKLYENICEYIKYKDREYNSIKENKYIIHKKKEEIQIQKKIFYANAIKDLAEEKRINGINNITKRNNTAKLLFRGNVDDNVVLKNIIKKKKKLKDLGKNKNNYNEKEFKYYIGYDS